MRKAILFAFGALIGVVGYAQNALPYPPGTTYWKGLVASGYGFAIDGCSNGTYINADGSGCTASGSILGYTPVNKAGDNVLGPLTIPAVNKSVAVDGTVYTTLQQAINALGTSGGEVVLPKGTFNISSEVSYNCATNGPLKIRGQGNASVLNITTSGINGLHITGSAGNTRCNLILQDFQIESTASSAANVGLLIEGIADFTISNVNVSGNGELTTCEEFLGSQQGEVSGGAINGCNTLRLLQDESGIHPNGIKISGTSDNTTIANSTGISVINADDFFYTSNHIGGVSSGTLLNLQGSGIGFLNISGNHLEGYSTGVTSTGPIRLTSNNFYPSSASSVDLSLSGSASLSVVEGNSFGGVVNVTGGASNVFLNNYGQFTLNDSGSITNLFGTFSNGKPTEGLPLCQNVMPNGSASYGLSMDNSVQLCGFFYAPAGSNKILSTHTFTVGKAWKALFVGQWNTVGSIRDAALVREFTETSNAANIGCSNVTVGVNSSGLLQIAATTCDAGFIGQIYFFPDVSDTVTPETDSIVIPNGVASNHLDQFAANSFAGSCTMSGSTSCVITISKAYSTPLCVATIQGTTAIAASCSVSGTNVTVTAATANSGTWTAIVVGNPN